MRILLWKEILLLIKTFIANDYNAPNNTAANVTAANTENDNALVKKVGFWKRCSIYQLHFKINGVPIDNAEDLDLVVMAMYNLLEYSKNYRKTTVSLWNCYRDKPNSVISGGINYSIMDSKSWLQSKIYRR